MLSKIFSRQEALLGSKKQKAIFDATIAIIGVGALGSVSSQLLVRSGIGKIILIDRDVVEESNLQRQILFTKKDIGRSKAIASQERLEEISTYSKIESLPIHLSSKNISTIKNCNLILDCTDNLETRFLLNDFCKKEKIPWIYAAAIKEDGFVMPIFPNSSCLRCFLKESSNETCDTVGVLNTTTTIIAAMQTALAIKIITKEKVESALHYINLKSLEIKKIKVKMNEKCQACQGDYEYLRKREDTRVISFCGKNKYQIIGKEKDFAHLKKNLEKIDEVIIDKETLRFKNITLFKDGRALVDAASQEEAQASYSKWIGN